MVNLRKTSSGISCFNDFIKRTSSSYISSYVGRGNSISVINSFKVSGILTSDDIIIKFLGCVFKVLLKFFNLRVIERSFKKLS